MRMVVLLVGLGVGLGVVGCEPPPEESGGSPADGVNDDGTDDSGDDEPGGDDPNDLPDEVTDEPACQGADSCGARECGQDLCGNSCGSCAAGSGSCSASGLCLTSPPECAGGSATCAGDGFGFIPCGYEPAAGTDTDGLRVACPAGVACTSGSCAATACVAAKVMLILDRSSSMLDSGAWAWVQPGVEDVVYSRNEQNRLGLRVFPKPGSEACAVGDVHSLELELGEYPDSVAQLIPEPDALASTPIAASLEGLENEFGDPAYGQAVILVTDGDETCGDPEAAVLRVSQLFRRGIATYVVAVTTTANRVFLDHLAQAGGTGQSYLATDRASLEAKLQDSFRRIGACHDCGEHEVPSCEEGTLVTCDAETQGSVHESYFSCTGTCATSSGGAECLEPAGAWCFDASSLGDELEEAEGMAPAVSCAAGNDCIDAVCVCNDDFEPYCERGFQHACLDGLVAATPTWELAEVHSFASAPDALALDNFSSSYGPSYRAAYAKGREVYYTLVGETALHVATLPTGYSVKQIDLTHDHDGAPHLVLLAKNSVGTRRIYSYSRVGQSWEEYWAQSDAEITDASIVADENGVVVCAADASGAFIGVPYEEDGSLFFVEQLDAYGASNLVPSRHCQLTLDEDDIIWALVGATGTDGTRYLARCLGEYDGCTTLSRGSEPLGLEARGGIAVDGWGSYANIVTITDHFEVEGSYSYGGTDDPGQGTESAHFAQDDQVPAILWLGPQTVVAHSSPTLGVRLSGRWGQAFTTTSISTQGSPVAIGQADFSPQVVFLQGSKLVTATAACP